MLSSPKYNTVWRWRIRLYTTHRQLLCWCVSVRVCSAGGFSHISNIFSGVKRWSIVADCFTVTRDARIDLTLWRKSGLQRFVASTARNEISTFPGIIQWTHSAWWIGFYVQAVKAINRLFNPVFNVFSPGGNDAVINDHHSPTMLSHTSILTIVTSMKSIVPIWKIDFVEPDKFNQAACLQGDIIKKKK